MCNYLSYYQASYRFYFGQFGCTDKGSGTSNNYATCLPHLFLGSKEIQIMHSILKIKRAKFSMTQQELAAKVGVSRQTINSIEAERYVPSMVLAITI